MIISSPLYIQVSKNKKFYLNLNQYRNAHYFTLNTAKVKYRESILDQVQRNFVGVKLSKYKVKLTYFPGSKRKVDLHNVCTIHEKFFHDVLVEEGIVVDDNINHALGSEYSVASLDRKNPRVEIQVIPVEGNYPIKENKEDKMNQKVMQIRYSKVLVDSILRESILIPAPFREEDKHEIDVVFDNGEAIINIYSKEKLSEDSVLSSNSELKVIDSETKEEIKFKESSKKEPEEEEVKEEEVVEEDVEKEEEEEGTRITEEILADSSLETLKKLLEEKKIEIKENSDGRTARRLDREHDQLLDEINRRTEIQERNKDKAEEDNSNSEGIESIFESFNNSIASSEEITGEVVTEDFAEIFEEPNKEEAIEEDKSNDSDGPESIFAGFEKMFSESNDEEETPDIFSEPPKTFSNK